MSSALKPRQNFHISIPIMKIDEEQRMVWGIATSEDVDSYNEIVDFEASKKAFNVWPGNIREMHAPKAVGKGVEIKFDEDTKTVIVGAKISKSQDGENAWIKIKEGILTGFSIGGKTEEFESGTAIKDGKEIDVVRITGYKLVELSLVDHPANPRAQLVMVKSIDGVPYRVEVEERTNDPHSKPWWLKFLERPRLKKADTSYNKDEEINGGGGSMADEPNKDNPTPEEEENKASDTEEGKDKGNDDAPTEGEDKGADDKDAPAGDDKGDDAPADADTPADPDEAPAKPSGEDKGAKALDLIKNLDARLDKMDKAEQIQKAVGEIKDLVESKLGDLEKRVDDIAKSAKPLKGKTRYADVSKSDDEEGKPDEEVAAVLKKQAELAANPVGANPAEVAEVSRALRKFQLQGRLPGVNKGTDENETDKKD